MQQTAGINHTMNNTYDDTKDNNNEVRDGKLVSLETTPSTLRHFPHFPELPKKLINYDSVNHTIYYVEEVPILAINRIINSSDALNNTSDKNWILNANISIANNATLFINSTDT